LRVAVRPQGPVHRYCVTLTKSSYEQAEVELDQEEVEAAGEDIDEAAKDKFFAAGPDDSDWAEDWEVKELKEGEKCVPPELKGI
jgi:hypothetical protein